ncbi:MAG: hypothetical protein ACLR2E_07210 [Lachnospiraceae bacterium]
MGPDLVLLDVMLPKVDGFAVLELIPERISGSGAHGDSQRTAWRIRYEAFISRRTTTFRSLLTCRCCSAKIAAVLRRTGRTEQKKTWFTVG